MGQEDHIHKYGWLRLNEVRVRARLELKNVPHAALGLQHHRHCAVCATERSHRLRQAANPLSVLSPGAVRQCSAVAVADEVQYEEIQGGTGGTEKRVRSENSQEQEMEVAVQVSRHTKLAGNREWESARARITLVVIVPILAL